ncbi:TPA: sn-glycerol-3-phosphate ABC transporter ATP-binding protein UgpC [Candidatus Poribacteria bacterium]|nr:sn-glycerol-3-phosphate ABC transporter ATP-binding protein UgpC [Candidatus Poribacteria bacterium]
MATVTLVDVEKIYPGDVKAVENFNLVIEDGEFIVLVGPSGCGKSTTLRMIAGLEEITDGEISIGDLVVNHVSPKDRDIAMVFQNYALYPHMSVRENMEFGLKLRKYPKAEIETRINDAAQVLGLTDLLHRKPRALSGGQRQRVAVGRAIVRQPAVFLFDEPLSNLDAKLRVQMRVELSQLHNEIDTTMIYVTHDQVEAMTMGDRIVVMNEGLIQQVADPVTLYDRPVNKFVASFIGTPPMNFFNGQVLGQNSSMAFLSEDGLQLQIAQQQVDKLRQFDKQKIVLGIRPEHIGSTVAENSETVGQISAVVNVVEPIGAETYVYLKSETTSFVSRVSSHKKYMVGEKIELAVAMDRAHFFDFNTDKALL